MTTGDTERVGAVTGLTFPQLRALRRDWVFYRAVALGKMALHIVDLFDQGIDLIDRDLLC